MCWCCHHAIICGENKQILGWPKLHLMQLFSWPPIAKTSRIQAVNSFGCCSSKRARGSEVGQWCKEILIYGAYCYILWLGTVFTQPLPLFKAISTGHKLGRPLIIWFELKPFVNPKIKHCRPLWSPGPTYMYMYMGLWLFSTLMYLTIDSFRRLSFPNPHNLYHISSQFIVLN